MSIENIKTLYKFPISVTREVDEVTTTEVDDKTITETKKVKKPVNVFFAFKKPSRVERESAEEERAVWWSKYVERGIAPEAILLKTYANFGGILSEAQKKEYTDLRVKLFAKGEEHALSRVSDKTNKEEHNRLSGEFINLRDQVLKFEQEQATFFENTAEAKARTKLSEYLILTLSYFRDSEDKPWVPFFSGKTVEEKAKDLEAKEESENELFLLSKDYLYFLASFLYASGYSATTESIDSYLKDSTPSYDIVDTKDTPVNG